jgi:hypothetical protein
MATDSLKMATTHEAIVTPIGAELPVETETSTTRMSRRIKQALEVLLESFEYAQDLGCSLWNFAVELSTMRRIKLSNSDLRWMIAKGLIDHAIEVTPVKDSERSFRRPARAVFCKKICFVLTPEGTNIAKALRGDALPTSSAGWPAAATSDDDERASLTPWLTIATEPELLPPKWDRDRQELKIGSIVIKRFRVPAANQEAILAAFEEEGWPVRIDDPLSPHGEKSPKRRLQETIKSLNRNQKRPILRFLGDGSGQGVRWEYRRSDDPVEGS